MSCAARIRVVPSYLAPIGERITDGYGRSRWPMQCRVCFCPSLTEVEETTPPVMKFGRAGNRLHLCEKLNWHAGLNRTG